MNLGKGLVRLLLALVLLAGSMGSMVQAAPMLSGNVPTDSYVYDHLEKLDGLGLLKPMLTGSKPYSRLQVAGWVLEMEAALGKQKNPSWLGKALLKDLRQEFAAELARLASGQAAVAPKLREWKAGMVYTNGDASGYPNAPRASYQPLNSHSQGIRYDRGMNAYGSLLWEGSLGPDAWVSLTPRVAWGQDSGAGARLHSGYVKLRSGNTEFFVGKDPLSWGQGRMGSNLLLSDNATPLTRFQISNIESLRYRGLLKHLGAIQTKVFFALLGDREYWIGSTQYDHNKPGLYGIRFDFQPAPDFTIGAGYTSMFGGRGINMGFYEFWHMLLGKTNKEGGYDYANGLSGIDFRWRFPKLNGMQLYGGWYTEDNTSFDEIGKKLWIKGHIGGIYIPRLTPAGDWDLTLEAAGTGHVWYMHNAYSGGHTYDGQILGDPMGGDANRYSLRLNHYLDTRTQIGLTLERVVQGASRPVSQRVDSLALSLRHRLTSDLLVEFTGGLASRDNADFVAGATKKNKFVSCAISQRF